MRLALTTWLPPLLLLAAACGPYTTAARRTAPAGAAFAASATCEPGVVTTATESAAAATATGEVATAVASTGETPTVTAAPDAPPTCPPSQPTATVEATTSPTTIAGRPGTSTPAPTAPSPPQLTATPTPTPTSSFTPEGTSFAVTATARAGTRPIAYLSIGDGIQWGCCGALEASSAAIFRAYLESRLGRPAIWQTSGYGAQTTDTFISAGSEPQLEFAVKLIHHYRDDGVPIAAITISIGGNNLVDIGRACASPPCTEMFIAGLVHLREQLTVIYARIVAEKDEHTPLLVLLYYDSNECKHNPYSGPAVDAWNAVIADVATQHGAFLVDARTPFRGHCDWIDANGLDASAKGHAAIAAEYERVYETLPPELRFP